MYEALLVVFLIVAIGLVGLIMLQQGKGADMGASFGAGASATLFGSSGQYAKGEQQERELRQNADASESHHGRPAQPHSREGRQRDQHVDPET